MRKALRNTGAKPLVAFANQQAAIANIDAKMQVLGKLIADASEVHPVDVGASAGDKRVRIAEVLPCSVRQFNAWSSDLTSKLGLHQKFYSNAQITLKQSGRYGKVEALIRAVKLLKAEKPLEERREEGLAALRRRVTLSNQLRLIAERELLDQKRVSSSLRSEVDSMRRRLDALGRETEIAMSRASSRIKELEESALNRSTKVVSLPPRKRPGNR